MRRKLRVLYMQLPVMDFGYDYAGADHSLAGGFLAVYALMQGVIHEPLFLPTALSSYAADPALVKHILDLRPDVVAASLMLWNVERTIEILREVQIQRPAIRFLAGGPEAVTLARRFRLHPFDWVCTGEGEGPFSAVLAVLSKERGATNKQLGQVGAYAHAPVDLSLLPSPYLSGLLPLAPDRSLWVETMRGCPFGCFYCYYGKSHCGLRYFSDTWLARHFAFANRRRASEMYFLDPSFQITPGLKDKLAQIAVLNRRQIPLHTEAHVEEINPAVADAFVKAGFASIETGFQSLHIKVLNAIHRRGHPQAFIRGARALKKRTVKLQVDVILGLPKDTPQGFLKTIDFLVDNDLADTVSIFPLLLLPGTELAKRATVLNLRHQHKPPYQIGSTPGFDVVSLRQALDEAEQRLDQAVFPLHYPDLGAPQKQEMLLRQVEIDLTRKQRVGLPEAQVLRLAQCPVFLFHLPHPIPWEQLQAWGQWQRERLPNILAFFGLKIEQPFSKSALLATLGALHNPSCYQARLNDLAPDAYLRLSCRPFVLSSCKNGNSSFWLEVHRIVPVIRISDEPPWPEKAGALAGLPVLWDTQARIDEETLARFLTVYRGREDDLLFSRRENALAWKRMGGVKDCQGAVAVRSNHPPPRAR